MPGLRIPSEILYEGTGTVLEIKETRPIEKKPPETEFGDFRPNDGV